VTNEPVVVSKISGPDTKLNLAGALQPGMRAVSFKSSDVAGVGGFALPGDRVDVLLTRQVGTGKDTTSVLQVLAENVRVMGVDQSSDPDKPTVSRAVTIEVTPEQAQSISLAQAVGEVSLALRQSNDATPLSRRAMTVSDLGPLGAPRPARRLNVSRSPRATIRVTRGVEVATYNFN
jgi:pilus assembly protein CpaB